MEIAGIIGFILGRYAVSLHYNSVGDHDLTELFSQKIPMILVTHKFTHPASGLAGWQSLSSKGLDTYVVITMLTLTINVVSLSGS